MAKKKQRQPARNAAAPPTGLRSPLAGLTGDLPVWTWVVATLAGALSIFFLLGYSVAFPLLVAPLLAGAIVGLIVQDLVPSAVAGGVGGLVGGLAAAAGYTPNTLNANFLGAPAYANPDVLVQQLYGGLIAALLNRNPVVVASPGPTTTVVLAVVVTAAAAAGITRLVTALPEHRELVRSIGAWTVVSAVAIVFVFSGWTCTTVFRQSLEQPPTAGGYAYDAYIYMGAYQAMLTGDSYYTGIVKGAAGDARLIKDQSVRNGKFYSWINAPWLMRQPAAFLLMRVFAPTGPPQVLLLALVTCALVLLVMHWALVRISYEAALLAPVVLYPILLLSSAWMNIFFPDFWATLAMLVSLAFLLRRYLYPALAFALLAALCRETFAVWLIAVVVVAFLHRKDGSRGTRDLGIAAATPVVFAVLYGIHYHLASLQIASQANKGAGGFGELLASIGSKPFVIKFMAPLSYMMWPYGFFRLPGAVLAVLGVVGLVVGLLQTDKAIAWVVGVYGALWLAMYALVGASSSYWGQDVMPLFLIGVTVLLTSIARLDNPASTPA